MVSREEFEALRQSQLETLAMFAALLAAVNGGAERMAEMLGPHASAEPPEPEEPATSAEANEAAIWWN